MRLWIDECLSPTLVAVARRRFETTCNEYRGLLHAKDPALYTVISEEEWVLVTNNEADFGPLTERGGLHSGLILLPQRTRADQTLMLEAVLEQPRLAGRSGTPNQSEANAPPSRDRTGAGWRFPPSG